MTNDEFRRWGHELIEWIARYREQVESYPVLSQTPSGWVRQQLPPGPPEHGEDFQTILGDVERIILPGITHWQSPNFFAFFPSNNSPPSILGELLAAGLGVQGMLWTTSPACTELETHMLDWLIDLLALPEKFRSTGFGGGVIQDTASSATLCALLAARERATDFACNRFGVRQPLVAYASTQAHSSMEKDMRIGGLGAANLRAIDVDESFALKPAALESAILRDKEAGLKPFFVLATIGTTSTTGLDPLRAMGEICRRHGLWLHADAAMSGSAAVCPEFRFIHDGLELADSYCFNPHKWLLVNFDCDCFWVADRAALTGALSVLPEYLRNQASASGKVIDYRDWQIPLGRRFRALKLWFVLRTYGASGLQELVRRHVALAQELADWIKADRDFELAAPVPLNLVCFRHRGGDTVNQQILDRVNATGRAYLTHTRLHERLTLRLCVGQATTERRHVVRVWQMIRSAAG